MAKSEVLADVGLLAAAASGVVLPFLVPKYNTPSPFPSVWLTYLIGLAIPAVAVIAALLTAGVARQTARAPFVWHVRWGLVVLCLVGTAFWVYRVHALRQRVVWEHQEAAAAGLPPVRIAPSAVACDENGETGPECILVKHAMARVSNAYDARINERLTSATRPEIMTSVPTPEDAPPLSGEDDPRFKAALAAAATPAESEKDIGAPVKAGEEWKVVVTTAAVVVCLAYGGDPGSCIGLGVLVGELLGLKFTGEGRGPDANRAGALLGSIVGQGMDGSLPPDAINLAAMNFDDPKSSVAALQETLAETVKQGILSPEVANQAQQALASQLGTLLADKREQCSADLKTILEPYREAPELGDICVIVTKVRAVGSCRQAAMTAEDLQSVAGTAFGAVGRSEADVGTLQASFAGCSG